MELIKKKVYFDEYCKLCIHEKIEETKKPCSHCLSIYVNVYSHKPVDFVKKE